jgi:dTDP-glucose 4,6-dehydratase
LDCWEKEGKRVNFVYHDFRAALVGHPVADQLLHPYPDYIIHMGAESHVARSIKDPGIFVQSNIIGTFNMLEFARANSGVDKFIYVSTDEVYGPVERGGYDWMLTASGEDEPWNRKPLELHMEGEPHRPSNPYSASKAAAEDLCYAYFKTYGVPIIITNTMNNFGERQDPEKFVPMVIKQVITAEDSIIPIHCVREGGGGSVVDISSRCWLHARNHADGIMFLLEHGIPGEKYNIVGDWMNVEQMADLIMEIMQHWIPKEYWDFHPLNPGHDMHYGLDGSKMKAMGWVPPVHFKESLANTVFWYMKHPEWLGL